MGMMGSPLRYPKQVRRDKDYFDHVPNTKLGKASSSSIGEHMDIRTNSANSRSAAICDCVSYLTELNSSIYYKVFIDKHSGGLTKGLSGGSFGRPKPWWR
jgi:hypothetical protein